MSTQSLSPASLTRRDLRFTLPANRVQDWHAQGLLVSHFFNTLSLFFPVGERFFIDSVRHYRDLIADAELQAAVKAFIGQEAMHGREHDDYNAAVNQRVAITRSMEARVGKLLGRVQAIAPPSAQLAITLALEHMTALMADGLLKDPALLDQAETHYAALWRWHAAEETEHKAVAYDVYRQVVGRSASAETLRVTTLVLATGIFWAIFSVFYLRILSQEQRLTDWRGWGRLTSLLFGKTGFIRKLIPQWLDYFRPGFHPWDHDNRQHLQWLASLEATFTKAA